MTSHGLDGGGVRRKMPQLPTIPEDWNGPNLLSIFGRCHVGEMEILIEGIRRHYAANDESGGRRRFGKELIKEALINAIECWTNNFSISVLSGIIKSVVVCNIIEAQNAIFSLIQEHRPNGREHQRYSKNERLPVVNLSTNALLDMYGSDKARGRLERLMLEHDTLPEVAIEIAKCMIQKSEMGVTGVKSFSEVVDSLFSIMYSSPDRVKDLAECMVKQLDLALIAKNLHSLNYAYNDDQPATRLFKALFENSNPLLYLLVDVPWHFDGIRGGRSDDEVHVISRDRIEQCLRNRHSPIIDEKTPILESFEDPIGGPDNGPVFEEFTEKARKLLGQKVAGTTLVYRIRPPNIPCIWRHSP